MGLSKSAFTNAPSFPSHSATASTLFSFGKDGHFKVLALLDCKLLDKETDGRLTIHDYYDHCPDWIKRKSAILLKNDNDDEIEVSKEIDKLRDKKKQIDKSTDPWYLKDDEILERIMLYEKDKSEKQVKYWKDKLRVIKKRGYMSELKDVLKEIWNSENFGTEKDVGQFKNPAGYINKKVKEMLNE